MSDSATDNEEDVAVTKDSEPAKEHLSDRSRDDFVYSAEGQVHTDEVDSDQHSALPVDGSESLPKIRVSPVEVPAAEDRVEQDGLESSEPVGISSELDVSGEIEIAGGDASPDSNQSNKEVEAPVVSHSGDSVESPQTCKVLVDPNADEATTSPHGGLTEPDVEQGCDGGTSKSDDVGSTSLEVKNDGTLKSEAGGRVEMVQFEDDQMLLERDGKFRMVNTDDVMADDEVRSRSSSSSSDAALRISSMSVKTGSGVSGRGRMSSQRTAGQIPRSKSAVAGQDGARRKSVDQKTTHRLTEDQKKQLQKQQAVRAEQARQDEEERREKDERKRQQCDDAFREWLRRKRIEAAQRRRERIHEIREERERNNKNKDGAKSAFEEWLKVKKEQMKQEAKNEQEREKEREVKHETRKRSKKEAERAFKKWLRKKHREARLQAKMSQSGSSSQQNSRKGQKQTGAPPGRSKDAGATQSKSTTAEAAR